MVEIPESGETSTTAWIPALEGTSSTAGTTAVAGKPATAGLQEHKQIHEYWQQHGQQRNQSHLKHNGSNISRDIHNNLDVSYSTEDSNSSDAS
jgi:hypothetical protein